MQKVAKFEKISFEQFKKDWLKNCPTTKSEWLDEEIRKIYDNIILPKRGTTGSAGYDIFAPFGFNLIHGSSIVIPTGLRCRINEGWFLDLNPRSGQGFKFGVRLANSRGIIDSDYYNADNEGHIMVKLVNESCVATSGVMSVDQGKAFCQGIFTIYGITEDDFVENERTGGFGSTNA